MERQIRDQQVKIVSGTAAVLSLVCGVIVFLGWLFDIDEFKTFCSGAKSMKFNSSICILLASISLLLLLKDTLSTLQSFIFYFLLGIVAIFVLSYAYGYLQNEVLRVDEFFIRDTSSLIDTAFPGRASQLSLICLSLTLLILFALKVSRSKNLLADILSIVLFFISLLGVLGYLYGIEQYSSVVYNANKIALPTALCYFFLSLAFMTAQGADSVLSTLSRFPKIRTLVVSQLAFLFFFELTLGWLQFYGVRQNIFSVSFGIALFFAINFLIVGILVFYSSSILVNERDRIRIAEQELRESKLIAGYGSYKVDLVRGTWTSCEVFDKLFGITENHSRTIEGWQTVVHHGDARFLERQFDAAFRAQLKEFAIEHRVYNPTTNKVLWVRNNSKIHYNELGQIQLLVGNVTDITATKKANDEIFLANCLYAFISQVNQAIVQSHEELELFEKACSAGISFGKFKVVSIAKVDDENKRTEIISQCGYREEEFMLFNKSKFESNSPQQHILNTGKYYLSNTLRNDPNLAKWHAISIKRGWQSYMALPLKKNGKVYATFSFLAKEADIFTDNIIQLLSDAAEDLSFALDVLETEKIKAAALIAMQESEEKYKNALTDARRLTDIMDRLPNYIYIKNLKHEYIFANQITLKLFKVERDQLIGKKDSEILSPNMIPKIRENEAQIISTGKALQTEIDTYLFDTHLHYLETKYPLYTPEGEIWALCAISTDITQIKKAEKELTNSRNQFKSVLQTAKQSILILDQTGQILFANQYAEHSFGYQSEQLSGLTIFTLLSSLKESNYWATAFDQDTVLEAEFIGQRADGTSFPLELSMSHWQNGKTKQYCAIIRDTSERKDLEFKKSLSNKVLSVLNENKKLDEVLQNTLDLVREGLMIDSASMLINSTKNNYQFIESSAPLLFHKIANTSTARKNHALHIDTQDGTPKLVCNCGQHFICKHDLSVVTTHNPQDFYSGNLHIQTFESTGINAADSCLNQQFGSLLLIRMKSDDQDVCIVELKHSQPNYFSDKTKLYLKELAVSIKHTILRDQSKRAIQESEERFRTVLAELHVGVVIHGANCEILMSNDRALELLGLTPENLLGKTSFDPSWHVIHEDGSDFPGHTHPAPVSIATKKPVHNVTMGVFQAQKKDFVWLLVNAEPRFQDNGELIEVIVTFEDITELTNTGTGIKVREEKYRLLFDNMPAGIMVCELVFDSIGHPVDYHFIGGNHAFELKTGLKASEQMGKGANSSTIKWTKDVLEKCYEVAVTGIPYDFELYDEYMQKYFETRIFSPRYGQFAYVFYDISERKTAEKELAKSVNFNSEILASLKSKLAVIAEDGLIITTNDAWTNYIDEEDETTFRKNDQGTNFFEDCEIAASNGDDIARQTLQGMKQVLGGEVPLYYSEYARTTRTGQRWYSLSVMKFKNDESKIICLYEDISARKIAEQEREAITNDIVARNKNLEQFSYIVSHNLRAPVANIMGISRFLQQDTKTLSEEDTSGLISGLITSVDKLDVVIKDLNTVLQIRNQSNEIKDSISLKQLVQDIKTSISSTLTTTGTKINLNFKEVDKVVTVKSYLYSIIYNLISNSIKYRKEGVPPVISITSHKNANHIELVISDNGMGIDLKKYGDQLFGLYKRFHYHTDGKGVGLFMVKTQIESLGGKIRIESKVNEGSTFYISFEN